MRTDKSQKAKQKSQLLAPLAGTLAGIGGNTIAVHSFTTQKRNDDPREVLKHVHRFMREHKLNPRKHKLLFADHPMMSRFVSQPEYAKRANRMRPFFTNQREARKFENYKKRNIVLFQKNDLATALHELGHAADYRRLGKIMIPSMRYTPKISQALGWGSALLSGSHAFQKLKGTDTKSKRYRSLDWVEKHPGTITALGFAPQLAAEFSASARALNYIRKHAPQHLPSATKRMLAAYGTYATLPLIAGSTAKLLKTIADRDYAHSYNRANVLKHESEKS